MVDLGKNSDILCKKTIFLGTENAIYHPMEGIDLRLAQLLPDMVLHASADTGVLNPVQLKSCALLILYSEFEQPALSDGETAAILSYAAEGGPVLIIHNGISVQNRSELAQLIGAKFTGHPPYERLPEINYHVEDKSHPVMEGVEDFKLYDEYYQFEIDPFADRELLLTYDYEGGRVPAGWVRSYGKGRIVYICCGHNKECFNNKDFSRILTNAANWLTKERNGYLYE